MPQGYPHSLVLWSHLQLLGCLVLAVTGLWVPLWLEHRLTRSCHRASFQDVLSPRGAMVPETWVHKWLRPGYTKGLVDGGRGALGSVQLQHEDPEWQLPAHVETS